MDAGGTADPADRRGGLVHQVKFPGFINHRNVTSILFLAVPLALVAMGQTHALLVGFLDLSVGAMVTLAVVIASFLIGPDSTTVHILLGSG